MLNTSAYVLILAAVGLVGLAAAIGGDWERFAPSAYASGLEPVRPGQESSIRKGVFAKSRLWLLSDAGELWSLEPTDKEPIKADPPGPVVDICAQRDVLVIASQAGPSDLKFMRREPTGWRELAKLQTLDEGLVSLTCEPGRLVVITSRRLVKFEGDASRTTTLSNRLPSGLPTVVLASRDRAFVGVNAGEWGGGLVSIDTRTGQVSRLERNATGELCGGPLNGECDPVNAIAASPWKPDCIVAAVGLVHMLAHGRLVEVCGSTIATAYSEPCSATQKYECTSPFYGLRAVGGRLLAISPNGLVSVGRDGRAEHLLAPAFEHRGSFEVAFGPSYALVKTSINQRRSLSGVTPLLIAR